MTARQDTRFDDATAAAAAWYVAQRILAAALLFLLLPLFTIVFVLVRATSRGPFLYSQSRPGFRGDPFRIWKIRTMRDGADRDKALARCVQVSDPRVTFVGRILRHTKLDELPQLWNVVRGEMAFVGPRPIAFALFEELQREIHGFEQRLAVRPGLTNLGQVCIEENAAPEHVVEDWRLRFEAERHYLNNRCLWYDLVLIALTVLYLARKVTDGVRRRLRSHSLLGRWHIRTRRSVTSQPVQLDLPVDSCR